MVSHHTPLQGRGLPSNALAPNKVGIDLQRLNLVRAFCPIVRR